MNKKSLVFITLLLGFAPIFFGALRSASFTKTHAPEDVQDPSSFDDRSSLYLSGLRKFSVASSDDPGEPELLSGSSGLARSAADFSSEEEASSVSVGGCGVIASQQPSEEEYRELFKCHFSVFMRNKSLEKLTEEGKIVLKKINDLKNHVPKPYANLYEYIVIARAYGLQPFELCLLAQKIMDQNDIDEEEQMLYFSTLNWSY